MTDAPPKRRAWFQLHLSTCVVLIFTVGILLLLNFSTKIVIEGADQYGKYGYQLWGWPAPAYYQDIRLIEGAEKQQVQVFPIGPVHGAGDPTFYSFGERMIEDVFANILVLTGITIICERVIRRREGKRRSEPASD